MENWTFASIPYQRPDVEQTKRSYQAWTEQVKNAKDYAEVRGILLEIDRATMPFDEQCTVAYIRNTLNTADEFYEKELEYLNDALPELEQYSVACYEALFDSPFRKELEQEFGRQLFAQIELRNAPPRMAGLFRLLRGQRAAHGGNLGRADRRAQRDGAQPRL